MLRGDLEFFVDSDKATTIYQYILGYNHFLIALLCIIAIRRVFTSYYRPHLVVFLFCAGAAFVTVSEGYAYFEAKLTDKIALENSQCWSEAATATAAQYKTEAIAPQLLKNLRQEIKNMPITDRSFVDFVFPNLSLYGNDLVVDAYIPLQVAISPDQRLLNLATQFAKATYCNYTSYFRLARALGVRLVWNLFEENRTLIGSLTLAPHDCGKK